MAGDIKGRKPGRQQARQVDFIALSRDLSHLVQGGVYVVQEGRFVYVNPFFEKLTGYSSEELTGKRSLSLVYQRDRATVKKKAIRSLKSRKEARPYEFRFIKKGGDLMWVLETVTPITYLGKRATLGTLINIDGHKRLLEDLARSEERYRNILDQMFDSYYEVDLAGNFTFVNQSVCLNLGFASEEMVGRSYRDFVPKEDVKRLFDTFHQCFTSGQPNRGFVHGIYRKDGSTITVESSVDLCRDEKGEPVGFRSIVRDVTERIQLEEELRKLAAVVWHSHDLINIATLDGRMTYLNEAGARLVGIALEEVGNFNITDIVPEHFRKIFDERTLKLLKDGSWEGELQYLNLKSGQLTDVFVSAFTVNDPKTGEPMFVANVSRDITLRKQAEAALKESQERYSALFDRSLDLVYVRDFDGNFLDANPAALNLLGYSAEDIVRLNIADLLTPDQYPQTLQTLKELKETGTQKDPVEYRLKCKDGSHKYVETKEAVIYHSGQPYAVQGIGRDITERKLADSRSVIRRDLAIALARTQTMPSALSLCLEAAVGISGMDSGAIYLVDEKKGIRLMDHRGMSDVHMHKFSRFGADTLNARVVLKGNPVYVRSEEITQPFKDQFEDVGIRVMCIVPIKHAERVVACLIIASRLLDEITVSARNSLETIAAEIGNAVDRINSREALLASEQRYRFIAENTNDVIWAMDSKLRYTYISPSVTRQRGYTVEEAMTLNITSVIAPEYIDDVLKRFESMATTSVAIPSSGTNVITQEWEMLRKDGSRFWTESSITVLYNNHGAFSGVLGVTRDITDRKLLEQKLEEMATHDYLTGLPNRKLLEDRFTVASALANRKGDRLSLMTVDLDNFKPVNDTYGHGTGDLVLKAVSARLSGIIRASDTIARIGGDEFLLMLQETNHTQDTRIIAEKIIGAFEEPFIIDGQQHQLSASIGISSYPGDGQDLTILVKKSDDAMYAAKRSGGKRFIFYNEIGKPGPAQGSLFS